MMKNVPLSKKTSLLLDLWIPATQKAKSPDKNDKAEYEKLVRE